MSILKHILNKKIDNFIMTGTVSSLSPLQVKLYPGDDAINVIKTTSLLDLKVGSNVILLKFLSKFIIISVIGSLDAYGCVLYRVATQSISNATFEAIAFGTGSTVYDPGSMHSEVTNNTRITIKKDGVYNVSIGGRWQTSASGHGRVIYIYKNGTYINSVAGEYDSAGRCAQSATVNLLLEEDDYIEFYVYQASGGALTFGGTGANQINFSVVPILGYFL